MKTTTLITLFSLLLNLGVSAQTDFSKNKSVTINFSIPANIMKSHTMTMDGESRINKQEEVKDNLHKYFSVENLVWSGNSFSGTYNSNPSFSYEDVVKIYGNINEDGSAIEKLTVLWSHYNSGGDRSTYIFSETTETGRLDFTHIPATPYGNSFKLTGKNIDNPHTVITPKYFKHSFGKGHGKRLEHKSEQYQSIALPVSQYTTVVEVRFSERQRGVPYNSSAFNDKTIRVKTLKGEKGPLMGQYAYLVFELCNLDGLRVYEGSYSGMQRIKAEAELNESGLVDPKNKVDGKKAIENLSMETDVTILLKYKDGYELPSDLKYSSDVNNIPFEVQVMYGDQTDHYIFYGMNTYLLILAKLEKAFAKL